MTTAKNTQPNGVNVPHSEEAERAVLGSIMIDPSAFIEVASTLKDSDDFYLLRHRVIYQAMVQIKSRKDEIDPIVLADSLESSGDLEGIGGRAYLIDLANTVGTSMHATVYAELVARTAIRRRMMQAASDMYKIAQDESIDIDAVQSNADTKWLEVTSDVVKKRGMWMSEAMSQYYEDFERLLKGAGVSSLQTGLVDLDNLLYGFSPEQLIILAGRPGMGKSAAMDNIALHIAKEYPIFYATSERSIEQLNRRLVAIKTGINSQLIQSGKLSREKALEVTQAMAEISNLPIYIDDTPMPRPRDIYARAEWMIKRHGCKMILFDGMYRSKTGIDSIDSGKSEHLKYGRIALELKTMARALKVPVLVTHQLSRAVENRQNKRPMMSDLRESGRIEEEADKILFLYRDIVYNTTTDQPNGCDWILSKHRDGPTGTVSTYFDASCTRFMNASVHRVDLQDLE